MEGLLLAHELRSTAESGFKVIADRAVDDAIALQESVGLEVVTDGEMRGNRFRAR